MTTSGPATDEQLRAMALERMKVGTWLRGGLPPINTSGARRVVCAKVDCAGHVIEMERELTPDESMTIAWSELKQELATKFVERWHQTMDEGRLPV